MTFGITGFGAYVPRLRLERSAIAAAHRWMAPSLAGQAKGRRAFCSWDEDPITMAVEAARNATAQRGAAAVQALYLASTTLPYADLQNASIAGAAIGVPPQARTLDLGHSQRAATSGLIDALAAGASQRGDTLFIASERPVGKPASVQELLQGAGAAALTLGHDQVIAECLGHASRSALFVDHFRAAGQAHDYFWEERWVRDEGYQKLVPPVVAEALAAAKLGIGDMDLLVMPSPLKGVAESMAKALGFQGRLADNLGEECGHAGSAHGLLMLCAALEQCQPGERLLVVGFGQGADAIVLQATEAITSFSPARRWQQLVDDRLVTTDYLRLLSFHGGVELEWGMRSEREAKTALTELYRSADVLSGFNAGRCSACGTVQFPQLALCVNPACRRPRAQFEPQSLRDEPAAVLTFTLDWLSYHPAPPLVVGFVQFRNGARLSMEMVDVGAGGNGAAIEVGTPLRMVYRIKERDAQRGFDRYFWKATPLQAKE